MHTFFESGLKPEILRAVEDLGFKQPTPIQIETLGALEQPKGDLVALAQTGTGKTAGFGLPLIHHIDSSSRHTQALILCPTRELCLQITRDLQDFSKYLDRISITAVYGGAPVSNQARSLDKGPQIVVGTPGRVLDMIRRGSLKLSKVEWFILDEADEMLNMGFKDELEAIFVEMPKEKSTWLFSATMPSHVERIAKKYMGPARQISIGRRNEGAANVSHEYVMVKASDRYEALRRLADTHPDFYGVVFCRTRRETTELAHKLSKDGYPAQALNGDLSQAQRDSVMRNFRSRSLRMLVATDVAARGIDVDDLTHVINYTLPDDPEVYVHRSGRTGRAGKTGICLSILHSREGRKLREIERMLGKKIELKKVPTVEEIIRGRVLRVAEDMRYANADHPQFSNLVAEMNVLLEDMDRDQIVSQITRYALQSVNIQPVKTRDINMTPSRDEKDSRRESKESRRESRPKRRERKPGQKEAGFTTLEINVGSRQELKPNRLMGVINEVMGTDQVNFGRIEIDRERTSIDVEEKYAQEVAMSLSGLNFRGRQVDVIITDKPLQRKPKFKGGKKLQGKKKFHKSRKNRKK